MRRGIATIAICLGTLGCIAAPALAAAPEWDKYDIKSGAAELSTTQAGAHADFTVSFALTESEGEPYALTRDIITQLPAGLFGNPEEFPQCTGLEFGTNAFESDCPQDAQVGAIDTSIAVPVRKTFFSSPIYNMAPVGDDMVARFGFYAGPYPIFLNVRLDPDTNALVASVENAPAAAALIESVATFWGVPANPIHDSERQTPAESLQGTGAPGGGRPSTLAGETPFMTNPTSCAGDRSVTITATSYQLPGVKRTITVPFPEITGCGALGFNPTTTLKPTTAQASSPSGLEYGLELSTRGLLFPNLQYGSELKRAEVVLPEGMSINPSEAEGLGVCTEADLARETYDSAPNVGCPETSKIGSVVAETPVIDRKAEGSLFLAKPYENPFGSLLALYMVLKVPDRGVLVKIPGEVRLNPATGQITTVFDEIPQLPVANFHLSFREGARAPLVTPYACGSYGAVSNMTPWGDPGSVLLRANSFAITSGPDHGPCPTGGLPPFRPGLVAGTLNNAAGAYSPFDVRLTRTDSEQEITHFSIKLPPGVVGKLAGIPFCPELSIAAAKGREGTTHGGEEELAAPSCPAASQIGTTLVGAGVGDTLVYVPGKVYLAGPYHGSNLSIVAITTAKAGPFDLGTVVVREALRVNPETAEVSVDAAGSDPIPHIIDGIPVHLRDIRVYVDRNEFVRNPTNCKPTSTASTVLGSGLNFASEADDNPVTVSTRFQAADCAALGFKPKLSLSLKGKTRRGGLPKLTAVVTYPKKGSYANIARTVVTLPKSEFLEQGHIGSSCTRVQFNAGAGNGAECPKKSILGHAKALTPLLGEPLAGNVYLRSNGGERRLPDLVAALHSQEIDINLVGFIDSLHKKGSEVSQIRNTFAAVPDAPVSRFTLELFGGKKGLLVNSTNICRGTHKAISEFTGQNGKLYDTEPAVKAKCGKKAKKAKGGAKKRHGKGK